MRCCDVGDRRRKSGDARSSCSIIPVRAAPLQLARLRGRSRRLHALYARLIGLRDAIGAPGQSAARSTARLRAGRVRRLAAILAVGASSLGVKTLSEFIAVAKERSGELSYAATGRGTLSHLTGEALQQRAGIKLLMVPYLGGTPQALNDVISGRVAMVIDAYPPWLGALQAGSVRALAVGSTKRLPEFADLPTVAETLPWLQSWRLARSGRSGRHA